MIESELRGERIVWIVGQAVMALVKEKVAKDGGYTHSTLESQAATYRPGERVLIHLTWRNSFR
ncbi:hypothetical protein [Paenibacillus sp. QZ-Y1]|uniref:hypothetical protein n=1 Tax=Paenibacillus sp. QZ-Y1 TaxID=3414511 RepID=UPI003F7B0022